MSTRGLLSLIEKSLKDDQPGFRTHPLTTGKLQNLPWISDKTNLRQGWSFSTECLSTNTYSQFDPGKSVARFKTHVDIVSKVSALESLDLQQGYKSFTGLRDRLNSLDPSWFQRPENARKKLVSVLVVKYGY